VSRAPKITQIGHARKRVAKWLFDEGFSVWEFADEESHFSYKANRDEYLPLSIFQPHDKTDSILVAGDVRLSEESQRKLSAVSEEERKFMLYEFKMVLLSTECRWQLIPSSECWKAIRISKAVFYDGLSKDRFFEALDVVTRAMSSVILAFQWKFGVTPYVS
jgi:hypothetical protein